MSPIRLPRVYRLIKTLFPSPEEEMQDTQIISFENPLETAADMQRFARHAEKCRKTNSGEPCGKCRRLGGWPMENSLKEYTSAVRKSPSTTTRPFTKWYAEEWAWNQRAYAIGRATTEADLEEFARRVWNELGVSLKPKFRFLVSRGSAGTPKFLIHIEGSLRNIVPVRVDRELEDWVSGAPWISPNKDFESFIIETDKPGFVAFNPDYRPFRANFDLDDERRLGFAAAGSLRTEYRPEADKPDVGYYEHFTETDSTTIVRVYHLDGSVETYRVTRDVNGKLKSEPTEWAETMRNLKAGRPGPPSSSAMRCSYCGHYNKVQGRCCEKCGREMARSL